MTVDIRIGDCRQLLAAMPDASVHCVVTSPPYFGLRDYGVAGQIGLEPTPDAFVAEMVAVFREVRRVLRGDGTLWLNLGDSYSTHAAGKVANPMAKSTLAGVRTQEIANESSRARGDYYRTPGGLPEKNLLGIPWRVAFALQADGWYLRQDIIWSKPNPMPESVTDRCTKAHEYLFLLSKSGDTNLWKARDTGEWSWSPDPTERLPDPTEKEPDRTKARWQGFNYYFDAEAIKEPMAASSLTRTNGPMKAVRAKGNRKTFRGGGVYTQGQSFGNSTEAANDSVGNGPNESGLRNRRSVWPVATMPFKEAHFATFPPKLIEPCILAGCPAGGTVLDPFGGAGTTGLVADRLGRKSILLELNPQYAEMARRRIADDAGMFAQVAAQ